MAQYDPKVIRSSFRGCVRTYYSYDDELYAGTFPEEWAMDHAPETGPKDCENCRNLCFNGVFLGYCGNCAIHVYNGTRCKGFISPGVELHNSYNHDYDSAFDLYLYEVNLHDVGDTDIHDTMAEIINRYASEFIHRNPRDVLAAFARMNDELCGNGDSECKECVEYSIDTNGTHEHMTDHNEERMGYDYDIAAATADAAYDDADYPDQNEHVAEAGPSAFDWDESGRRRFYRMGYDEYRMDYDSDADADADADADELCGQGYGQVDIDYVIDVHNRRQSNEVCETSVKYSGPRPFDDGDDDVNDTEDIGLSMPEEDFDYLWDWNAEQNRQDLSVEPACSMNTQESVPEPDMPLDESDAETDTETEPDVPLDETVHCMICENTKYNCACDEDIIHQSVFCYTCENPRYVCECDEESRNKTHYCLHCEKVKYNCICVDENSVYMRVARKYCMQHC